jgi:V8-like Glu-specific endopeptidase
VSQAIARKNRSRIALLHSGLPDCASPIVSHADGHPDILGMHGTGFFARKGNAVIFITARHCLGSGNEEDLSEAASRLRIPYILNGVKKSDRDFIEFDSVYSFEHQSSDIPGSFVDFVILTITVKPGTWQDKRLRSRAAKLPPTGNWLDEFARTRISQQAFLNRGIIQLVTVGYPRYGTQTEIDDLGDVVTQSVVACGTLGPGVYPHTMTMTDITWQNDLNGFSGSPVFLSYRSENGIQCALAGVLVAGGNRQAQFIRINQITGSTFDPPLNFDIRA